MNIAIDTGSNFILLPCQQLVIQLTLKNPFHKMKVQKIAAKVLKIIDIRKDFSKKSKSPAIFISEIPKSPAIFNTHIPKIPSIFTSYTLSFVCNRDKNPPAHGASGITGRLFYWAIPNSFCMLRDRRQLLSLC
jgi:hypothetical protein